MYLYLLSIIHIQSLSSLYTELEEQLLQITMNFNDTNNSVSEG